VFFFFDKIKDSFQKVDKGLSACVSNSIASQDFQEIGKPFSKAFL